MKCSKTEEKIKKAGIGCVNSKWMNDWKKEKDKKERNKGENDEIGKN